MTLPVISRPVPPACPLPVQREQLLVGQLAVAGHVLLHRRLRDPVLQYLPGAQMQR
ncbi:hypothetical protein K7395_33090 [Streptomyces filamentosus]|uniref:Uncharacterized protein n=1 Tax=Streptomyces filamentosus TaxID=67294 RepID=A0ABY4VAI1_STRFL|nr:hypothetical protein K7395_33090 [Streptomyces filamentosus]